jgi:hypothetical protein
MAISLDDSKAAKLANDGFEPAERIVPQHKRDVIGGLRHLNGADVGKTYIQEVVADGRRKAVEWFRKFSQQRSSIPLNAAVSEALQPPRAKAAS